MFAPHCPTCDRPVLLGPRRVIGPSPAGAGFLLRCHCGTTVASHQAPDPSPAERGAQPAQVVS